MVTTETKKVDVARVEKFLTEYQNALSNYERGSVGRALGLARHDAHDDMAGVLDDKKKMAEAIAVSYPFYKQLGLDRVEHTINEVVR